MWKISSYNYPINTDDVLRDLLDLYDPLITAVNRDNVKDTQVQNLTEDGFEISFDMPGLSRSDIVVTVSDRLMRVTGKSKNRNYSYSYKLPKTYTSSTSRYDAGVLTIKVSTRKPEVQTIEVE